MTKYIFIILILFFSIIHWAKSRCTMTSPGIFKYNTYPAVPNKVPITLPDKYHDMLMSICPHFINYTVPDENPNTFCCNSSQVEIMKNNFVKIDTTVS